MPSHADCLHALQLRYDDGGLPAALDYFQRVSDEVSSLEGVSDATLHLVFYLLVQSIDLAGIDPKAVSAQFDPLFEHLQGCGDAELDDRIASKCLDDIFTNASDLVPGQITITDPGYYSLAFSIINELKESQRTFLQKFLVRLIQRLSVLPKLNQSAISDINGLAQLLIEQLISKGEMDDDLLELLRYCKLNSQLLLKLFTALKTSSQKSQLIDTILSLANKKEEPHFNLQNSSITLSSPIRAPFRSYTTQFWVSLNNLSNSLIYSLNDKINLHIEASKLSIYYKSKFIDQFNTFQFEPDTFYHIVLIHENQNSQRARAKLRLYVDGNYISHIRCPFPFVFDELEQDFRTEIALSMGSHTADLDFCSVIFVTNSLPYEWILLSYYLGKEYIGRYQDPYILQCLNYDDSTKFSLRLLESTNNRHGEYNIDELDLCIPKESLLVNFNKGVMTSDIYEIRDGLLSSEVTKISGPMKVIKSPAFHELFYSISSLQLIYTLIEEAEDLGSVNQYVRLLLNIINSNWKFIREVESNNGYNILATLLKNKKSEFNQSLSTEIFETILGFVGYNFQSPFTSVISNYTAYDLLISDLHLWKGNESETSQEDHSELIKFLLFQITVFSRECKYATFNSLKIKKMKIIRKFLNNLSQGFFRNEDFPEVHDTLSTLLQTNLSHDNISLIASFVIYALHERNFDVGILALKVLAESFLDPLFSNATYWKKLFGSVSIKWALLLLQTGKKDRYIVQIGLSLLIKIFTVVPKSYDVFVKNNGLSVLLSVLGDANIGEIELNLLIKGAFGQYVYDLNFERFSRSIDAKELKHVTYAELNYLILDLLEYIVLNDIFQTDSHDKLTELLNHYTRFLNTAFQENSSFTKRLETDLVFLKKLCNMILLLTKPQNTTIYFDSAQRIIQLLSSIIISKMFNAETNSLETYFAKIFTADENSSNSVSTIFVSHVFPEVLVHLKGFITEFESLLQSNSIKFANIGVFLNLLNNELLTFEWNFKDYLNYLSVLLSILEAYKSTGRSLKNAYYLQLVKNITFALNALCCVMRDSTSKEHHEELLKEFMFHQANLFSKTNLTNDGVSNVIALLLNIGSAGDSEVTNTAFNCLRIILMMRHEDLATICSCITFRNYISVMRFLSSIMSSNDEDVIVTYLDDPKLRGTFSGHLDALENKVSKNYNKEKFVRSEQRVSDLILKYERFVKVKYENVEALAKTFQAENENLKLKIVANESMRTARALQDQRDNSQFYITQYKKIKTEQKRILALQLNEEEDSKTWTLDHMEAVDRMRMRLLPYEGIETEQAVNPVAEPVTNDTNGTQPRRASEVRQESQSLNSFEFIESDVIEDSLNTYNDRNRKVLKSLFPGDKIHEIWNVSQVIGLEIVEGILILGQTHLYLIQNYFHKSKSDEIIEIDNAPDEERDSNIKLITGQPRPKPSQHQVASNHTVHTWDIYKLTSVTKRQFLLRDVALELFFSNGSSFLITSVKTRDRDVIFSKLSSVATNSNIDNDLSNIFKEANLNNGGTLGSTHRNFTTKLATVFGAEYLNYLDATKKWQNGEMSNFYYLMIVNTLSGRTFNDLTQYPVFPWVIADYTSEQLDLNDPKSFRDLSKPMGAQSEQRANQFQERYEALKSLEDEDAPPFHYGTHYSSAMIVASFLIRLEPFVQSYLLLQGGSFDHADRLFYSISKAWKSASQENTTDVRELIPEFFFLPEFLTNINRYDFGKLQDGTQVSDVELPKWAKGDPKIFIAKNREALESPYVSQHLHEWIDLVFGFKQQGPEAVKAINVFNHLSYAGAVDLDSINNEDDRRSITGIIHNFGQTPLQIFNKPHPEKEVDTVLAVDFKKVKTNPTLIYQTKFRDPIKFLHFKTHSDKSGDAFWRGYPDLHLNGEAEIKPDTHPGSLVINRKVFERLHDDKITAIGRLDNGIIFTGSETGIIHVWRYIVLVKGFDEQLSFESQLRLHTSAIKELKVSPEFNSLVSLDAAGNCYLWDLARYKLIRNIGDTDTTFDHVAIAYDNGLIAASSGFVLQLFTINGELVLEDKLSNDATITSLSFGNSRTHSTVKVNNVESHEFWKYYSVITSGWSNGDVILYEVSIKKEGGWALKPLVELKFTDGKESKLEKEDVTITESYFKSYFNYEEEKVGKVEVIAGDINGRVAVWR